MNVLDVGPGVGRLAEAFIGVNLTILDISEIYKEKLLEEYNTYDINIKNIDIKKEAWRKLPYSTNQFDVVTSSLVLLHQPPDYIKTVMSEILRVGKRFVCLSTRPDSSASHVFNHNYKEIVEGFNLLYNEIEITDTRQIYFTVNSEEYEN